ncbi:MAG: hypothetical protein HY245_00035 [Rhizobiales bacterium]|nr:hypothetical protein [Hyphomicrobiales bacterium]
MTTDPTPDAEPAVKPQVIDLQAEDVTVAETPPKAAPSEPTHPPTPPRRKSSGRLRWIAVALVVGLAGCAWLYRDLLSTYLPTNEMTALSSRVGSLEAGAKTMGDQLQAVAASADQASKTVAALDGAVKDAAAGVASVRSGLADFDRRLAATDKSLQSLKSDIDKLRAAVSSGTGGGGPADATALAAIGQRLDGLEKDVASLKAGQGTGADTAMVAALRQALSDIQAKIAAGVPYRDELDRILRMVPSVGGNDGLAAHADEGLPAARGLAQESSSNGRCRSWSNPSIW